MANEIPASETFTGLSRKVIEYSERFATLNDSLKTSSNSTAAWAALEALVDTENFERIGVFLTDKTETFGWATYKSFITEYAADTEWEGTLRFILEEDNRVVLGLEERKSRGDFTRVSNTVTVYTFNPEDKLQALEVYVMDLN